MVRHGLVRRLLGDMRRGENIDAYVTVAAAIVLSILNITNVLPTASLSGVILAVLALLSDQELSFGAAIIRPGTSQAVIYLQYYAYRGTRWDGLRLLIRPADQGWYGYHLAQIDQLWDEAEPWNPQPLAAPGPSS